MVTLVGQEENDKSDDISQWLTVAAILIPAAIIVVVGLGIYIGREHLRVNRALYRREWKIPYEEIEVMPVEKLRISKLFSRSPGFWSSSVFTRSGDNGSRWDAGRVKVGTYQVCYCCCSSSSFPFQLVPLL